MVAGHFFEIPVLLSLGTVCAILAGSVLSSLHSARPDSKLAENGAESDVPVRSPVGRFTVVHTLQNRHSAVGVAYV